MGDFCGIMSLWGEKSMKITTIRHGQTFWNNEGRIQGHADIALDDTGLAQAERVAARLAGVPCDAIYTSDLVRASKTAEIINTDHNAEIIRTTALREISFGIYEGQITKDIGSELAELRRQKRPCPGGEDLFDFFARVHKFLEDVLAKDHQNIFIVAHHGTIRAIICYFLNLPPERRHDFEISNTGLHRFEQGQDGMFNMTIENDDRHLPLGNT